MAITTPPRHPSAPADGNRPTGGHHRNRWLFGLSAGVAAVGLTIGLLVATSGTETAPPKTAPSPTASPAPRTTVPPGDSTTAPPTTAAPSTTAPITSPSELTTAVYPTRGSSSRFDDPVVAARAFMTDFVGFVDPVVGQFVVTGADSGTVDVRANASGAVTTVRLQRIAGNWWVLGCSTPDIRLDSPVAMAPISSPVRLQGMSTAFEAQVNVEVRQDGSRDPIGSSRVMGGSMGEMGPFAGSVAFTSPNGGQGALVLFTVSMQSGNRYEATIVRVTFAP